MKKILFIFLLLFILSPLKAFSLDTLSIKYFPIHVGDFYNYYATEITPYGSAQYYSKYRIIKDTIINHHKYYFGSNFQFYNDYNGWIRTDSLSGSIYKYDESNSCPYYYKEKLIDSLALLINDTAKICGVSYLYMCSCINIYNILGYQTTCKMFYYGSSGPYHNVTAYHQFAMNFGLIYYSYQAYFHSYGLITRVITLKGCKINGVVYGDTNTVGINKIGFGIPSNFSLFQNYPNPFNPSTNIRYQISNSKFVSLKVFDILGKEIEILVNEKQSPGTYEVNWNASQYPSGVYFYRLETEGFTDTKKMILLK